MRIYIIITTIILLQFGSKNSYGQDTITRIYRPWLNYRLYGNLDRAKRNNSFIKVVDFRGKIRFVGQVWSDCGTYNGETKEYFRNGKIKALRVFYISITNGCPQKNGIWVYYRKSGLVKKKVTYKQGVRVNKIKE
jgi:hypothetical protein